ncbi:MAG: T9SS type A sorting domain-containing protein [Bacteroidota bacterium]
MKRSLQIILLITLGITITSAQWQSALVQSVNGKLVYSADAGGNRIPDFSYAGFKNGGAALPTVPVVKSISPVAGDNTAQIQQAINEVAAMPLDANGIRGAILLSEGIYPVAGTIRINASGIVLRGIGAGADSRTSTVIYATGDTPHQRSVIVAGGGNGSKWSDRVSGISQQNITTDSVAMGSRSFDIADASLYNVGDNIVIYHPCTDGWLQSVDYGGSHYTEAGAGPEDVPWTVNSQPIIYNRYITAKNGNTITIDVPVFYALIKSRSQCYIYKYSRSSLRTMIGIENLRVDIETSGVTSDANGDENHAWQAIELNQLEDSWVKNCTMIHFGQSGVITNTATRVTAEDCSAIDPVSIITGERRYNFNVYQASQQILFNRCHATNGRHHFVSNGASLTSGCAFVDCTSQGSYASSEGHRRWSQALLFDNITELDGPRSAGTIMAGFYNRGYYGTSHGWAAVNSVMWNYDSRTGVVLVQKPPTGQNFAIGGKGTFTGTKPPAGFTEPTGYVEGANQSGLTPRSLYFAQLEDRNTPTHVESVPSHEPSSAMVLRNYPNPFNASTRVEFSAPESGEVRIGVYDAAGRQVALLYSGVVGGGQIRIVSFDGSKLASGVYILRLEQGNQKVVRRITLLK